MTPQWFLKGMITSLIINFMGMYGEANYEEKQEDNKYLNRLGLLHTAKDEKAFQMVKDRIKQVLTPEEGKPLYTSNDEGPRKYYYRKYMKLGKTNDESSMDYENKEIRPPSQHNFNKFNGNINKEQEKKILNFQELSAIAKKEMKDTIGDKLNKYSQEDKWKMRIEQPTVIPDSISNNKYSKENYSRLNNFFVNTSSHLKNTENFPNIILQTNELTTSSRMNDENFKWINNYIDQIKNQKEKYLENAKSKIKDYNNKEGINRIINYYNNENSLVNATVRTSRSLKGSYHKKKRKCYMSDKKTSEKKNTHKSNVMHPKDHRRVRSCDIKMEDLRESFIPNEQLSIYHPKMSLSDQFILQDTMF